MARSKELVAPPDSARTPEGARRPTRQVEGKGGRYHHGDLRRALIDAAIELVGLHGPSGLTLREAARRAGVTHAAPYRHFADKEALLAAVAEEGFHSLRSEIERAAESTSGLSALEAIGVAYVRFARAQPSRFRVMFGAQIGDKRRYPSLLEADQAGFDVLTAAIRGAQASGELSQGNPARMGMVTWSMLHGVAALVVDGQMERAGVPDSAIEEFARRVARTANAGLKQWESTR